MQLKHQMMLSTQEFFLDFLNFHQVKNGIFIFMELTETTSNFGYATFPIELVLLTSHANVEKDFLQCVCR